METKDKKKMIFEETESPKFRFTIFHKIFLFLLVLAIYSVIMVATNGQIYSQLSDAFLQTNLRCEKGAGCFGFYHVGNGDGNAVYTNDVIGFIDTGTKEYAALFCDNFNDMIDETIDFIVISHPHDDHAGGYEYILKQYKVSRLFIGDYSKEQFSDYEYYQNILSLSREHGVEVIFPKNGSQVTFGDIQLNFYCPSFYTVDENERSLITLAEINEKRCLYMGDCGQGAESMLVGEGYDISADILKLGHHGSKNSTTEAFLDAVNPKFGVICVGYNLYGHPADEITQRLTRRKISFYRTDSLNRVVFTAKDNKIYPSAK
jgi:competence protein ComEC